MPAGLVLRAERPGEDAVVGDVVTRAFLGEHSDLVDRLRASDAWLGLSFVAERDGVVVGHVCFNRCRLDAPPRLVDILVLSPLSVLPDQQGQGIGSALVRFALEELQSRPEPVLFLEGDPAYYARFGFVTGGELGFRRPSRRVPKAAFQVILLPSHEEWVTGTLVYHHLWWDLDAVGLRD